MSEVTTSLPVTKITYKQASELLGISIETLKPAIKRGVLQPLPRQGLERHLIAEQVELFKGKRLSLSSLDKEQIETWKQYRQIATGTTSTQIDPRGFAYSQDTIDRATTLAVEKATRAYQEGKVPEGVSFPEFLIRVLIDTGEFIKIMLVISAYRNGAVDDEYIRSIINGMSPEEKEYAMEAITNTDAMKPLRGVIATH